MNKFSVDPLQPGTTLWPLIGGDDQSAYVCDILGNQTIWCCQRWGFRWREKNSLTGAVGLCELSSKTASLVGHRWPGGVRIWQNDERREQWLSGNRVKWGTNASASAAQIAKRDHAAMQLVADEALLMHKLMKWMAKCKCVAYLGIAWHQGALWEEAQAGW